MNNVITFKEVSDPNDASRTIDRLTDLYLKTFKKKLKSNLTISISGPIKNPIYEIRARYNSEDKGEIDWIKTQFN